MDSTIELEEMPKHTKKLMEIEIALKFTTQNSRLAITAFLLRLRSCFTTPCEFTSSFFDSSQFKGN